MVRFFDSYKEEEGQAHRNRANSKQKNNNNNNDLKSSVETTYIESPIITEKENHYKETPSRSSSISKSSNINNSNTNNNNQTTQSENVYVQSPNELQTNSMNLNNGEESQQPPYSLAPSRSNSTSN